MKRAWPLRFYLVLFMMAMTCGVGLVIAWLLYELSTELIAERAERQARSSAQEAGAELDRLLGPIRNSVQLLALTPGLNGGDYQSRVAALPEMAEALRNSPIAVAVYMGNDQGEYFQLRKLEDTYDLRLFEAPIGARFLLQSVEPHATGGVAHYQFLDGLLRPIGQRKKTATTDYDPRQRPWYILAKEKGELVRTPPYRFFETRMIGSSVARVTSNGQVVGADLRHSALDGWLRRKLHTPGAHMLIFDGRGRVLAGDNLDHGPEAREDLLLMEEMSDPAIDFLSRMEPAADGAGDGELVAVRQEVEGRTWQFYLQRLPVEEALSLFMGTAIPLDEMMQEAHVLRDRALWVTLVALLLTGALAYWLAGLISRPIKLLAQQSARVRYFEFDVELGVDSRIHEVRELGTTLRQNRDAMGSFIDALKRLSVEPDFQRLLPNLLQVTVEAAQARGALLLIHVGEEGRLEAVGGLWGASQVEQGLGLCDGVFAAERALETRQTQTEPANAASSARFGLPPCASFSVPLFSRHDEAVGVLVLFRDVQPGASQVRFIEALSGFAAVALETRGLLDQRKAMFDSLIRLIATAVDAKSPYTAGHCARVPELARLLAEAACAERTGPFAGFGMTAADHEAMHIAAWLHDCGKITTPEYVVDKSTKLETLYDRIHEIRMRFEVLKRDAEIARLEALVSGADSEAARARRDARWRELDDDFAFVAECNLGGYMSEERLARLRRIAEGNWLRTLDDRLGISGEARLRKESEPVQALPVLEPLLADRPEHRVPRPVEERLTPDNSWGVHMHQPALLYDLGELKNLSIGRGTLTEEERYKINEHVVQTIRMLSALPFPGLLAQVPEIAGGHHERMDGKGYPRGLKAGRLSPQARMLAIADVLEALTARDRPYKPSKTLEQALAIMRSMCEQGHLDPDLFSLLLRSGACLRYAERYLPDDLPTPEALLRFVPDNCVQV
ncbi:phosphohydrolase [Pseudomonas taiwanensis]|uniref:HD domain-containing phosphohydrolase n=1 Tax=Pseudomonas taiwanensis TaxID=470150 RepID=UPI0015BBF6E1|nr:HD domain-containing phosphohydrolase [Pseudomonas taiwanensis]NWL80463.1 phosphohydrolase [Pseudomonas taiwanensis]